MGSKPSAMGRLVDQPLREKMKRHRMLTAIELPRIDGQIERRAEEAMPRSLKLRIQVTEHAAASRSGTSARRTSA